MKGCPRLVTAQTPPDQAAGLDDSKSHKVLNDKEAGAGQTPACRGQAVEL
jgi:hypothetical protein